MLIFRCFSPYMSTSICSKDLKTWFIGDLSSISGCPLSVLPCKFQTLLPMHRHYRKCCHHPSVAKSITRQLSLNCSFRHICGIPLIHLDSNLFHCSTSTCWNTLPQPPLPTFIYGSWTTTIFTWVISFSVITHVIVPFIFAMNGTISPWQQANSLQTS